MPHPYTLDDLHRMSWQQFETIAVDAVRHLYSKYGIEVSKTPYSQDDGRDGEAQHILAIGLGPDLAISIKVFLEIKKRQTENVGKSDLGSHVVDAFRHQVTKVIFITNRDFTQPLSDWLAGFCGPLNIQFSLVSGTRLLKWLNEPDDASVEPPPIRDSVTDPKVPFDADAHTVRGELTYTLDPNDAVGGTSPCTARYDRPVFAVVDIRVGESVRPFHSALEIVPRQTGAAQVHRSSRTNAPAIFSPGDRQRWVFAIWPERPGRWDDSCFNIGLQGTDVTIQVRSTNVFFVPEEGLGVAEVRPQDNAETALRRSLDAWRSLGGLSLRFLLSPGGLGKSFIVGRLRKQWQENGLHEVMLDGETVLDDVRLIERTFSSLYPFPKSPFDDGTKPALVRWLSKFNLSPDVCEALATDFCSGHGLQSARHSARLRAEMFAALLAEGGGKDGLVFVLEDLHKVSPSVISLLEEGASLLKAWGRGKVFLLLTSRPAKEVGGHDITSEWLARLQRLSAFADDSIVTIYPPTEQDAGAILQQTAPSLQKTHVRQIVKQVGTVPFNLREAVLYLKQLGVLQSLSPEGPPVLVDPVKLNVLLEHDGLEQTTRRRLEVFFRDQPPWLRKLIEAGACYGRQFPFRLIANAIAVPDGDSSMQAIGECARWSLVAPSPDQRENLEFDHDLVRAAVLALLPDLERRDLADSLVGVLDGPDERIRAAGLAYQAGRADMAFDLARRAANEQASRGRPADALRANHIALLTLDPEWARFDKLSSSWVDLGVQSAPACRREFRDWQQRDRDALTVLRDNLNCLGTVSSGSSSLSGALLTEARMLSQRLGDHAATASLVSMEGRLLFEQDNLVAAVTRHEEAEQMFAALGIKRSSDRAENLVRLAICYRQLGRNDESLKTLRQALNHREKSDWILLSKVRSNTGAVYLRSDWGVVRHHWGRQLRSARAHGLLPRTAHALASLSFINLFDGRQVEGRRQAEEALEIAMAQGLENTRLRCDLNLAVSSLIEGNVEAAFHYLNEAESIAVLYQIDRRLWRVLANLATAHEARGELDQAMARDLQTITVLKSATWKADDLLKRGRHLLPLINIALRAGLFPDLYAPVFPGSLNSECVRVLRKVASELLSGDQSSLDSILPKYLVDIEGRPRFLLTE